MVKSIFFLFIFIVLLNDGATALLQNKFIVKSLKRLKQLNSVTIINSNEIDNSGIERKKVAIANIEIDNVKLRGVIATENIVKDDIIILVPAKLTLEVNNNRPPTPFPDFVPQLLWELSMWDQRLAFKLLHASFIEVNSDKQSWIEALPTTFSTPFHWNDNDINKLQYPTLQEKIFEQRIDWKKLYERWIQMSSSDIEQKVSFNNFVWALESVNSRAFSGEYEGSTSQERKSLLIFTGLLTVLWPILHLGTIDQALNAAVAVGISTIIRDAFFSKILKLKRYVVCPVIDMINHKSISETTVSYNYFRDQFEVKSSCYNKNDQIFISYGKQSNDRLLQFYGFIESNNPNEIYVFQSGIIELLIKYGDQLQSVVSFPSQPSPQTRIEYIASILASTKSSISKLSNVKKDRFSSVQSDDNFIIQSSSVVEAEANIDHSVINNNIKSMTADKINTRIFRNAISAISKHQNINHFDDITVRVLRALYSSFDEWNIITQSNNNILQILENQLSNETELKISQILNELIKLEINDKETSLAADMQQLESLTSKQTEKVSSSGIYENSIVAILTFRIEKKKLLNEILKL